MYERLIAFLQTRETQLSEEDIERVVELLAEAHGVSQEYVLLRKQALLERLAERPGAVDAGKPSAVAAAVSDLLRSNTKPGDILQDEETTKRGRRAKPRAAQAASNETGNDAAEPGLKAAGMAASAERAGRGSNDRDEKGSGPIPEETAEHGAAEAPPTSLKDILRHASAGQPSSSAGDERFPFDLGKLVDVRSTGPEFAFDLGFEEAA